MLQTQIMRKLQPKKSTFIKNYCDYKCKPQSEAMQYDRMLIGNREVVGFGMNGKLTYEDRHDFPFPAIRWMETNPQTKVLLSKQRGDWRQLSNEEKKQLYRISFCQTFAEFEHSTGKLKSILGLGLIFATIGLWLYLSQKIFKIHGPLPKSFSKENQEAQLRRMLDLHVNPVTGLSSKWDYEKDDWKK